MSRRHGQERGNTLRVYLYAQKAWAGERKGDFVWKEYIKR